MGALRRNRLLLLCLGSCIVALQAFSVQQLQRRSSGLSTPSDLLENIQKEQTTTRWTEPAIIMARKATPGLWSFLVPKLWENPRGFDSTRRWTIHESTEDVARDWVQRAFPASKLGYANTLQSELAVLLQTFVNAVQSQGDARAFKARIVASRGSVATKCPQWHIDHVPVRYIQSLVGPGCDYVDEQFVHWESINALADDDISSVEERNQRLVDKDAVIGHAAEGQAMLLVGNRWAEYSGYEVQPCVHRSPHNLKPWEGRVLLTIDIDEGPIQ